MVEQYTILRYNKQTPVLETYNIFSIPFYPYLFIQQQRHNALGYLKEYVRDT